MDPYNEPDLPKIIPEIIPICWICEHPFKENEPRVRVESDNKVICTMCYSLIYS
jgi:hypothetical protein